jgi:hypothetical protein
MGGGGRRAAIWACIPWLQEERGWGVGGSTTQADSNPKIRPWSGSEAGTCIVVSRSRFGYLGLGLRYALSRWASMDPTPILFGRSDREQSPQILFLQVWSW